MESVVYLKIRENQKIHAKIKLKIHKNFEYFWQLEIYHRNWVFDTNSDFPILISLQPNFLTQYISNLVYC